MFWRQICLAGAVLLASAGSGSVAQTPQATAGQPAGAAADAVTLLFIDPRLDTDRTAAIAEAVTAEESGPIRYVMTGERCGLPAVESSSVTGGTANRVFDLDSALRTGVRTEAKAMLVITTGLSECLSVACALSASMADSDQPMRIDVLATSADAKTLHCLAQNTGGRFKQVPPDKLGSAAAGALRQGGKTVAEPVTAAPPPADGNKQMAPTAEASEAPPAQPTAAEKRPEAVARPDKPAADDTKPVKAAPEWTGNPPLPRPRPGSGAETNAGAPPPPENTSTPRKSIPFKWALPAPGAPESEPPPATGEAGIQLTILAGPAGPLIETDLAYEILSPAGDGTYRRVAESSDARPLFVLPEGSYIARVTHGEVVREFPFTITGRGMDHAAFSLDIGYVSLVIRPTAKAAPLESGITFTITRLGTGAAATPVTTLRDAHPMIALPAGKYRVSARSDQLATNTDITVAPGSIVKHDFNLRIGYLRLSAPEDLQDVTLQIEAFSTAGPDSTNVIASATGSTGLFRLQEGNYIAVAVSGDRRVEKLAAVKQGQLVEVTLPLAAKGQPHWWVQPKGNPPPGPSNGGSAN